MRLKRLLDSRAFNSLAALGLLLGTAAPAAIPAFASADQLSSRSVAMSTSAVDATDVSYHFKFTAPAVIASGGGVVIDFCSNTAVFGDSCTAPADMQVNVGGTSLSIDDVKYDTVDAAADGSVTGSDNNIKWTSGDDTEAGDVVELDFGGITNPSAAGVFYARVTTYANSTNLATYASATSIGTVADEGSMAVAATGGVGVTSYVLESMSFCVSKGNVGNSSDPDKQEANDEPSENCGGNESDCVQDESGTPDVQPGCVIAPSMTLGEQQASTGVYALQSNTLSTGQIWAQLSSNASGNTVVKLKSDAKDCGGLYLNGTSDETHCNIGPKNTGQAESVAAGKALFGLTVGAADAAPVAAGTAGSGSGTIAASGSYNSSDYFINYVTGNGTGVTSTYGDPLFETTGAVNNMNVPITFGTSITNSTPAGVYGATFSLIAVGTF